MHTLDLRSPPFLEHGIVILLFLFVALPALAGVEEGHGKCHVGVHPALE